MNKEFVTFCEESGVMTSRVESYRLPRGKWFYYSVVAAKLWNALPQNLRDETEFSMFKKLLKTFYFSVASGD